MPLLHHAADHASKDAGVYAMMIIFRDARAAVLHPLFQVAAIRP